MGMHHMDREFEFLACLVHLVTYCLSALACAQLNFLRRSGQESADGDAKEDSSRVKRWKKAGGSCVAAEIKRTPCYTALLSALIIIT